MFTLELTPIFRRDTKSYVRHGGSEERLQGVLRLLAEGKKIPASMHDHQLQGKLRPLRELRVEPDWLLVYEKNGKQLSILCLWLTTHKKLSERERSM